MYSSTRALLSSDCSLMTTRPQLGDVVAIGGWEVGIVDAFVPVGIERRIGVFAERPGGIVAELEEHHVAEPDDVVARNVGDVVTASLRYRSRDDVADLCFGDHVVVVDHDAIRRRFEHRPTTAHELLVVGDDPSRPFGPTSRPPTQKW